MKIILQISFILLVVGGILLANDSAYTLEKGQRNLGVFQPITYGMENNVELTTHPILLFVKPNVKIKKYIGEYKRLGIASRFSFDYPTSLLKMIQRKGAMGILSKDPEIGEIPNLFVFQGEVLATKKLDKIFITGKVGFSICPGCELDSRHIVDLPLAYPRMAVYKNGISTNTGLDIDYIYSDQISFKTDVDLFIIPEEDIFLEHKFLCYYQLSPNHTLIAGAKLTNGNYPFGKQLDFFPLIDLSWRWNK